MTCNIVLALGVVDLPPGSAAPGADISINGKMDGSFKALTYLIESTGSTSGTKYRTSALTITVGGYTATINIVGLGTPPRPGQLQYTLITITTQDILNNISPQYRAQVTELLKNPVDNVTIGANIQIYKPASGQVLATITRSQDIAEIAGAYGFGNTDMNNMRTRWQDTPPSIIVPPENKEILPTAGLRPSVLVP